MIDHSSIRLGKLAPVIDPRTLKLANYLTPGLPPPPSICDWTAGITDWGVMANDRYGDCTIAAVGHLVMGWTQNNGSKVTIPDSAIISAYSAVSGFNPRTGANDNGAVELDVLNYWRKTGVGGHTLDAFATVDASNLDMIRQAVFLFGGVYIGVGLPTAWQGKNLWDVYGPLNQRANQPGSWGGHAIPILGYDADGFLVITWGGIIRMTNAAAVAYMDESYAPLSNDWIASNKAAANGIDMNTLAGDLKLVQTA